MRYVREPTKLWTAGELLDEGARLERCEIWDGRLVLREPSGGWHGPVAVAIAARLLAHVRKARAGWVCDSSTGFVVKRNPDRVLAPDVSFVSRERLPVFPRGGFVPLAPDFVVEVKSPSDDWGAVIRKSGTWRSHDVPVAWAVHPDLRLLVELRAGEPARELGPSGVGSARPALPDFEMPVSEIFADLFPEGDQLGGDASEGAF